MTWFNLVGGRTRAEPIVVDKDSFGFRRVLALVAVLIASCGGGGGGGPPAAPSGVRYASAPAFVIGHPIAPLTPTVIGTVTQYSASPALPAGLSINATTGVISGTPTVLAPLASYTITASNAGGSTVATIGLVVNDVPPLISYGTTNITLTTEVPARGLVPVSTGGSVVSWSIGPALPAGLVFSTSDGSITGTPTVVTAAATLVVTGQNSGGQSIATLTIAVQSGVLLDLGHADSVTVLRTSGARVVSVDVTAHWVLWDYATGANLANGMAPCAQYLGCSAQVPPRVELAGPTLVVQNVASLELRSSVDGALLATISTPLTWWQLAADGSYVIGGTNGFLRVWSPNGAVIFSRFGDYSKASVFAAAGEVRVALGPAGASVIETVSVPSGNSTVGPAFQGQFNSWFLEGDRFLSNVAGTVWTYSKAGLQQDLAVLATVENLTGHGTWYSTYASSNDTLTIYAIGASGTPAATYSFGNAYVRGVVSSGPIIAALGLASISVIDLSGMTPTRTDHPLPIVNASAFAAVSNSQWLLADDHGVVLDGASLAGTPRPFGYGKALSIAGGTQQIAIATASGQTLIFDTATRALEHTIDFFSSKVLLSSDGTVLLATGDELDAQYHSDWSVNAYSLPSATKTHSWPYTWGTWPLPYDATLSGNGAVVGQVLASVINGSPSYVRQVTAVTGGPVLWSDGPMAAWEPIRLSPDGTLVAVSNGKDGMTGTNIFKNGALVTAVPGWVAGWIDNSRLITNIYVTANGTTTFAGSAVYDSAGNKLAAPPLPELGAIQPLGSDSIYDPSTNAIYSITTGAPTWTSVNPSLQVGAVAGALVIFASGNQLLAEPH
jgi:hypothetical protein